MNNLPDRYAVKKTVRDELCYQFSSLYDEEFYQASKTKQMHFISVILEILSEETDEWREGENDDNT